MSRSRGTATLVINATDCLFQRNRANDGGGAFHSSVASDAPNFARCSFIENYASIDGGAINTYQLTSNDCVFDGNEAGEAGGAVYINNNSAYYAYSITGGSFENNFAGTFGGAIGGYCTPSTTKTINGTSFGGNSAGIGYVYIDFENPLDLMDSFYSNNSIENRQTQGKVTYDTYVTNVSTWSTAPEGAETAPHIYNNYDIEVGMFLVAIEVLESDEGAAWWRNGALVGATDVGGFFQAPATINDFYNVFCVERYGYSIKKEGYELVGWVNNESMVSGYGTDVLALEEPLRGPAYLHPV